jgi:hypothetical protein
VQNKRFWIWNIEEHKREDIETRVRKTRNGEEITALEASVCKRSLLTL